MIHSLLFLYACVAVNSVGVLHVAASPLSDLSVFGYDPAANPLAYAALNATAPHARFTVLTDYVIRMEMSTPEGTFEDRATLTIVNRFRKLFQNFQRQLRTDG